MVISSGYGYYFYHFFPPYLPPFLQGYRQKRVFIIAQAPLEETCRDFWKMVYERECGVIVMLSGLVEDRKVYIRVPGILM